MKEHRINRDDRIWRVAFAFDTKHKGILLVEADKSSLPQIRFYKQLTAKADERFNGHLAGLKKIRKRAMTTTLKMIMDRLPLERQKRINMRANELIAEDLTLRDLRKAHDLTQERMAEMLGIGQDSVSRLEQRSDLLLSTLRSYVVAMGGSLELVARFPGRPAVTVSGLAGISSEDSKLKQKRKSAKRTLE